jgi:hypothetical protein
MAALAMVILLVICAPLARAQESLTPPEQQWDELLALAEAYQSNYLELVAICCYQLYASTGIIATDYANGYIDAEAALSALDGNSLLHSSCMSTLTEIIELTPEDDEALHAEAGRLLAIIEAEGALLSALREVCVNPDDTNVALTESARQEVEQLLNEYTAPGM